MDGVVGSLIVRIPREKDPSSWHYDHDIKAHTIVISDWLHTTADSRYPGNVHHNTSQLPASYLINGRGGYRGINGDQSQQTTTPRPRPHHGLLPHGQNHGVHHFLHRLTHGTTPPPRQAPKIATVSEEARGDFGEDSVNLEYPPFTWLPSEISNWDSGESLPFRRGDSEVPLRSYEAMARVEEDTNADKFESLKRTLPTRLIPDFSLDNTRTLHHLSQIFRRTQGPETPYSLFRVTPGKRYRFRLIAGMAAMCPVLFTIENHRLTVIAADGDPVKAIPVDSITLFPGERYDVVVAAELHPGAYWIHVRGTGVCTFVGAYQVAVLRYSGQGNVMPATQNPRRFGLRTGVSVSYSLASSVKTLLEDATGLDMDIRVNLKVPQ